MQALEEFSRAGKDSKLLSPETCLWLRITGKCKICDSSFALKSYILPYCESVCDVFAHYPWRHMLFKCLEKFFR